jgi:adenosyl cobinamide kinase/adenosyl cobinamide phosphate guanylyltransferase
VLGISPLSARPLSALPNAVASAGITAVAADTVAFSDSAAAITTRVAAAVDAVSFTDSAAAITTRVAAATDAVAFSDSAVGFSQRIATASDTAAFTDSAAAVVQLVATATDTVAFSDSAVAIFTPPGGLTASATDTVAFSDTATAVRVPGGPAPATATPGRRQRRHDAEEDTRRRALWLPSQVRGETEAQKRQRRIDQGIIPPDVPDAPPPVAAPVAAPRSDAVFMAKLRAAVVRTEHEAEFYRLQAMAAEDAQQARAAEGALIDDMVREEFERQEIAREREEFDIAIIMAILSDA